MQTHQSAYALTLAVAALCVSTVAAYNPPGPANGGCSSAGVSCCYSPTWYVKRPSSSLCRTLAQRANSTLHQLPPVCRWQSTLGDPKVTCIDGSFTRGTPDADVALNECQGPPVCTLLLAVQSCLLSPPPVSSRLPIDDSK